MVMADHDRINELQARVAGLTLAVDQLINALSALATTDPALATALNEHVTSAKTVLAQAEQRADCVALQLTTAARGQTGGSGLYRPAINLRQVSQCARNSRWRN